MARRLCELAVRSEKRAEPAFTHFLDLAQQQSALAAAREKRVDVCFFGGYEDAERCVAAFYAGEPPEMWQWPVCPVRISWRARFGSPQHRDLLGALMALGFEREKIGDIVLDRECAWLFAEPDMAGYIASSLTSAGRVSVRCERTEGVPDLPEPEGQTVRDTVPSLRLDAVTAACFSLSRAEAAQCIGHGRVYLNQAQTLRADAAVPENALISLRGTGRARLLSVEGETRKGRLAVKLFLYGNRK